MRIWNVAVLTTYILLTVISTCISEEQAIKVRVSNWPPKYFQDKEMNWVGVDVEIINAIIKEAGFKVEYQTLPWARGILYLQNGKIDIIPVFSITEERKAYVRWIGPYRNTTINLIVKKDDEMKINSLNDMIKLSVERGIKFGHQNKAYFSKEYNDRLTTDPDFKKCFEIISNQENNLRKLKAGRILGFMDEKGTMKYRIKNDPEYSDIKIHPFMLDRSPAYIGVSKKTPPEIYSKLKKAFNKVEKKGILEKIRIKWNY